MQPAFVNPESDAGLADALRLPIGVTIDSLGNVYTADWKDPLGTAAADLYVFSPDGTLLARQATSAVHGPVGIAVAGTALYGGPPPP
jgi:sugar lactone lactonase YvrE